MGAAALIALSLLAASAHAADYSETGTFARGGGGAGGNGSGPGELSSPTRAVLHQATGNLYVADTGNNRIEVFAPDASSATYLTEFGGGTLVAPRGVAIDEDTGDVYVSDTNDTRIVKFNSDGGATPTLTLDPGFTSPLAGGSLAFDQTADELVVANPTSNQVERYTTSGAATGTPFDGSSSGTAFTGLLDVAVDSTGDVIVVDSSGNIIFDNSGTSSRVLRFDATGGFEATIGPVDGPGAVTVDPDGDQVVVAGKFHSWNSGQPPHVYIFDSGGVEVGGFDINNLWAITPGIAAAGGGSARLYTIMTSPFNDGFGFTGGWVFEATTPPEATIGDATGVSSTSATFNGTVLPNGRRTAYEFQYRLAGGTWTSTPNADAGAGATPVDVSATVSGLAPNHDYEVRLLASNADGVATSAERTFRTAVGPPTVATITATRVGDTSAWLRGRLNPNNQGTTYWFEVGTTPAYGMSLPAARNGQAGDGGETFGVSEKVDQLLPSTTYHFRLVAENASGRSEGVDRTFTTAAVTGACSNAPVRAQQVAQSVPDCRAYEQVSPVEKFGYAVGKNARPDLHVSVAADGQAATYDSTFPFASAGSGGWSGVQGNRTDAGWATTGLLQFHGMNTVGAGRPASLDTQLRANTPDQRTFVYWDCTSEPYGALWVRRADGSRVRIADATELRYCIGFDPGQPWFLGISPDGRHVVFNSTSRLGPAANLPAGPNRILYEWFDDGTNGGAGTLRVVNRTDDAALDLLSSDDASLGSGHPRAGWEEFATDTGTRNAISNGADGHSRIFFQNPAPALSGEGGGALYARIDGSATVELSAPVAGHTPANPPTSTGIRYIDAAQDGSRVFFVADGDLTPGAPATGGIYAYDTAAGSLEWLADAPTGATTSGVANRDGSRLYYQSGDEVRLWVGGTTRLVWTGTVGSGVGQLGGNVAGFQFRPGFRTVECFSADVTEDGRFLAFVGKETGGSEPQVYRYDMAANGGAGQLDHVSTSPDAPAYYAAGFTANCQAGFGRMIEKRAMSEDGRYVFFDTSGALVSGDNNGVGVMDTYRWHAGEVELVSRGTGPQWSSFMGTDESGANAFFVTQDRLAPTDGDDAYDLYNARIDGGFPFVPRAECEGDGCQPPVTPAPPATDPGTERFSGPGNRTHQAERPPVAAPRLGAINRAAQRRFARTGRLTLGVRVGEAGTVRATATARVKRLKAEVATGRRTARRAGLVRVPIRLSSAARRQLQRTGTLRVQITVRFSKSATAVSRTVVLRVRSASRARRAPRTRRARGSGNTTPSGAESKGR